MAAAAHTVTRLAYDDEGAGTPVVFLHGLTFDRRSWRPIMERLDGSVRSIAIDLPAHGESRGTPPPFEQFSARRLEPALRGPGFAEVWPTFENSLGLERIPEPLRSLVLATHEVSQGVVIGYWEMALRSDPTELQAWIDTIMANLDVPCLGVFGRPITDGERERFERLPDVQLEEWAGDGHFVHLVDPDRFATRLRQFVEYCSATG